MDPPADHDGEEKGLRRRPPQRGTAVGSRYARLLLVLSFLCFVFTVFIYNRFLTPYLEVMTLSIDQPLRDFPLSLLPPQFQNISAEIPHHQEFRPLSCCGVEYFRTSLEWNKTTCSPTEEVFAWLMDQANFHNLTMMVAYGELIHILRDNALLRADGGYYDDDFDTLVTPSTFQMILKLEPYLWNRFGWSIRVFYGCSDKVNGKRKKTNDAIFAQILSACGHKYKAQPSKVVAKYPAIEMYIVQSIREPLAGRWREQDGVLRNNWQGDFFPESWLLPSKPFSIEIDTPGFNKTLNLQMPAQPEKLLDCLYGNWHVYSKSHSPQGGFDAKMNRTVVSGRGCNK